IEIVGGVSNKEIVGGVSNKEIVGGVINNSSKEGASNNSSKEGASNNSSKEGVMNNTDTLHPINNSTNTLHPVNDLPNKQHPFNTDISSLTNMVTDLTPISICVSDFPIRKGCYDLRFTSMVEVVKRIRSIVNSSGIRMCSVGVLCGENKWVEGYLWVISKLVKEVVRVESVDRIEGQYIDEVDGIRVCVNDVGECIERDISDGSS
ncbi:hypothetical protein CWI39_0395p0010, partial [Hamiltosporidium magnivora]